MRIRILFREQPMPIDDRNPLDTVKDMPEVVVMGAGAAGIGAALRLAKEGYKVILIEKGVLSSGASGSNPGRMGHGFHYADVDTAKKYLRASIQVQREYPGYLRGQDLPFDSFLRHGKYYIMQDTVDQERVLETYEGIKSEYRQLVEEDPKNEVFGPVESFYEFLPLEDEKHIANQKDPNSFKISMVARTAEHLFDWQALINDLRAKISSTPNITLHEHTEIRTLERGDLDEPRFLIRTKDFNGNEKIFKTDYIVNSTWQNIEALNDQLGFPMIPGSRTNRLKALVKVKLPESLREANSMFFCMGPHCMFTNLGNGYGMMTYANVTNMETSSELKISERAESFLKGEISDDEKKDIANGIINGVAEYIPAMKDATFESIAFGIVQTEGALTLKDLHNPLHNFHKRDYDGIREEQIGLISNPCMKLFYFVQNGEVINDLVNTEVIATEIINKTISAILSEMNKRNLSELFTHKDIKKAIRGYLERYLSAKESLVIINKNEEKTLINFVATNLFFALFETMMKKKNLNLELLNNFGCLTEINKSDDFLSLDDSLEDIGGSVGSVSISDSETLDESLIEEKTDPLTSKNAEEGIQMHFSSSFLMKVVEILQKKAIINLSFILGVAACAIGAILNSPAVIICGITAFAGAGLGALYRNSIFTTIDRNISTETGISPSLKM